MSGEKFLFVSTEGFTGDLAWQVRREGHPVKMHVANEEQRDVADGFVDKAADWQSEVDWADVIVFDDVLGMGTSAEELRRQGKAVVGGSAWSDRLEDDRAFGQEQLAQAGSPVTPSWSFHNFEDAERFVRDRPGRYVVKPSGEAQNDKSLVFLGEDREGRDVLHMLGSYRQSHPEIRDFQIQQRVDGVEVGVGGFFDGRDFLLPLAITFEYKRLCAGDLGPLTGEMGTCMLWGPPNRIFEETLGRLREPLADHGYRGFIDVNCMVDGDRIYPLEFTARFGYPTLAVQQESLGAPAGGLLAGLARGAAPELRIQSRFQVGVRVVVPPFPYDDAKAHDTFARDLPIRFEDGPVRGVHIEDVKRVDGEWRTAGESGIVLTVVGTGRTIRAAQSQAYRSLRNIRIPNMYYRTDIGHRWPRDLERLREWGYLR